MSSAGDSVHQSPTGCTSPVPGTQLVDRHGRVERRDVRRAVVGAVPEGADGRVDDEREQHAERDGRLHPVAVGAQRAGRDPRAAGVADAGDGCGGAGLGGGGGAARHPSARPTGGAEALVVRVGPERRVVVLVRDVDDLAGLGGPCRMPSVRATRLRSAARRATSSRSRWTSTVSPRCACSDATHVAQVGQLPGCRLQVVVRGHPRTSRSPSRTVAVHARILARDTVPRKASRREGMQTGRHGTPVGGGSRATTSSRRPSTRRGTTTSPRQRVGATSCSGCRASRSCSSASSCRRPTPWRIAALALAAPMLPLAAIIGSSWRR